jgi:hypothetical protein
MKKTAIIQSNYIPWKGYFDIIHDADLFIFHDDLQYTKFDWRNRNQIKTQNGLAWLTVPVGTNTSRKICDVEIKDSKWQKKHYETLRYYYSKAPYYKRTEEFLHDALCDRKWGNLSELNQHMIKCISRDFLSIKTMFSDSREFSAVGVKHEKVLNLLKAACADIYISGPAARNYIKEQDYREANIDLIWKDYSGYPEYPQLFGKFAHNVTILDLLFNTGADAPYYIWGWRENTQTIV